MAITYQSSAVSYGSISISASYPASVAKGDGLVLIVGQKPVTANGGGVTTPTGWSLLASLTGAGGYGATTGADVGNCNIYAYAKDDVDGSETGSLALTLSDSNSAWAAIFRLSNDSKQWSFAAATGSDATAGNVSIAFGTDPGVTAGDFILAGMVIPTDVTTPSQFSAEALSQSGITFGTVTEAQEPDSTTGNDIGGFVVRAPVSSGTSAGAPSMTATAGGTTTNVRGPGVFILCRQAPSRSARAMATNRRRRA